MIDAFAARLLRALLMNLKIPRIIQAGAKVHPGHSPQGDALLPATAGYARCLTHGNAVPRPDKQVHPQVGDSKGDPTNGLQYQLTHKLVIPKACTQDQGTTNLTHRLQAEPHLAQTNWPIRLANPLRLGSSSTITINTMQAYRSHAADIVCTQRYDPAPHGVQTQVPLGMNLSEFVHSHNFRLRVGG